MFKKLISIQVFVTGMLLLVPFTGYAQSSNVIKGTLTVNVEEARVGTFINDARIIVIDSEGNIVGNKLTNEKGEVTIPVTTFKDKRFPSKNMGEVTVIAIADGYNEKID